MLTLLRVFCGVSERLHTPTIKPVDDEVTYRSMLLVTSLPLEQKYLNSAS